MDIILNENKKPDFFLDLLKNVQAQKETKEVKIAVAYAHDHYVKQVINFCSEQKIHLSFFGRVKGQMDSSYPIPFK